MIEKQVNKRAYPNIIDLDTLVPKKHPLRAIDKAASWDKVYAAAAHKYSSRSGRPGIDPVLYIKLLFLQRYYRLDSLSRTVEEAEVNLAYRWFLGLGLMDKVPHPTTVSRNLKKRFDEGVPEALLEEVQESLLAAGVKLPAHMQPQEKQA